MFDKLMRVDSFVPFKRILPSAWCDALHCFAQTVARYERLRSQMRESTRQAELLFQGLLWESFGGER
jgi:hypothetical protein